MKSFEKDLKEFLDSKALQVTVPVSYSNFEGYHYQSSVLLGLKKKGVHLNEEELKAFLSGKGCYEEIAITGPGFISVKIAPMKYEAEPRMHQKVIVDYCGANVAKKMHIGHIRSMFIGDFIARAHESVGDSVTRVNHIGDWGNQFGGLLLFLEKHPGYLENSERITQAYKLAQKQAKEDPVFAEEGAKVAMALLERQEPKWVALWKELSEKSMRDNVRFFQYFGLTLGDEHTKGESFYKSMVPPAVNQLIALGLAQEQSDQSVVSFFKNKSPLVLRKSNGNWLYAAYDLAALKYRQEHHQPDKMVYVVDKRQALHFEQVFELAKAAKFVKETTSLVHVAFGAIVGADGKPLKTKEGDALYLEDLVDEGMKRVQEIPQVQKLESPRKEEVANATLVGGMKFYDLKFNRTKDYHFDWKNVLSFDGQSAPYIQNVVVRMDALLFKAGQDFNSIEPLNFKEIEPSGTDYWFEAHRLKEVMEQTTSHYESQALIEQMMRLCQAFHGYYEKERVLGENNQGQRLALLSEGVKTLMEAAELIGVQTYQCDLRQANSFHKNKLF
jgi:arginyl-tRNA synthetase